MLVSYGDERAVYFRSRLSKWGRQNRRRFPWRETSNPFHILLAEMMLRRTNAAQVVSIYVNITKRYPTPKRLATAPRREVLAQLEPLGLAWRAENIRTVAELLVKRFAERVPRSVELLKGFPGVGDYVANAVTCFAFQHPMSLVDTNTVRVAGRYFGFRTNAESRRRKPVRQAIRAVTGRRNTRDFNYAFLDFAALVCKPANPDCFHCPLQTRCAFGQNRLKEEV